MSQAAPVPAPGEKSLATLLATLEPTLSAETFVFLTFPHNTAPPASLDIQMSFREPQGQTIITTEESAVSHKLDFTFPSKMITLSVHSSLEAVGFIAVVSTRLSEANIGTNPVSGFFHDHCFVPVGKEEEAMEILQRVALEAKEAAKG